MYPLAERSSGPTVRIGHLVEALGGLVDLDVIEGTRATRRGALVRYARSGRLRGLDGVYVESSTALPGETDIAFLGLARRHAPVLTYVRDAYQLFGAYARGQSPWRRLQRAAFRPAMRALGSVSTQLAFPTRGLAVAVLGQRGERAPLLPPGAPPAVDIPCVADADRLLYVGAASLPAHGVDRLLAAVAEARDGGSRIGLDIVCRAGEAPAGERPPWLSVHHLAGDEIHALLPRTVATVIPRPRTAYNDLALPIKLFEYLSYGRPLLVTDCLEQAEVVERAGAGVVSGDGPGQLAAAIGLIAAADVPQRERWEAGARRAAAEASWDLRARSILDILGARA
ncbi:MAG: glycosyltransferase [Chloroflexi bacterium]|nr:glycosyltransferase [Chloroflexota bacterium]